MFDFYKISSTVAILEFTITSLSNLLFIYLTIFHIKSLIGTYKYMVLLISVLSALFSLWQVICDPFVHNFNQSFMLFSFNTHFPFDFLQWCVSAAASLYVCMTALLVVQFVYRYVYLVKPTWTKCFDGFGCLLWIGYPVVVAGVSMLLFFWLITPDSYADDYWRVETLTVYNWSVESIPRFIVLPYGPDGFLRWSNFGFLILLSNLFSLQYLIIIYCGYQMYHNMEQELQHFSIPHRHLQRQFFTALVVQTLIPTVFFVLPTMPAMLVVLFDFKFSIQSGFLYSIYSLYPPIDCIAFMVIVKEYRKKITDFVLLKYRKKEPKVNVTMVSIASNRM